MRNACLAAILASFVIYQAGQVAADDGFVAVAAQRRPIATASEFRPDPASIVRHGPAYRYPQAGWIVLHIEGAPYERGYQHGQLLAAEIVDFIKSRALCRSPKAPHEAWRDVRMLVNALFLRRYDAEFLKR